MPLELCPSTRRTTLPLGVADSQKMTEGLDLFFLGPQCLVRRDGGVGLGLGGLFLGLDPLLLEGLEPVLQVVGEGGAELGIVGGVEGRAARADTRTLFDVAQGIAGGEEDRVLFQSGIRDLAQGRVVIENVEAPAEGREHDVVLAAVEVDVADLDGGELALELDPVRALVDGEVDAVLGADEEQLRFDVVLHHGVGDFSIWQVAGDRAPGPAAVAADKDVGFEVAPLLVVEGRVDGVLVVHRGLEPADVGHRRHAGNLVDGPPVGAAVLGDLDETVVGADVDQALHQRRLGERDDVAVVGGGHVLGDRVDRLDLAEDRQRVGVDRAAEVRAHSGPRVAPVIRAVKPLRGKVEPGVEVGADHERRVPVPAVGGFARRLLGLDVHRFAARAVVADQTAVLPLAVDGVGVGGVDDGLIAVAADGDEPVLVGDARTVEGPGRPSEGVVVLGAAVDVVERLRVVDRDPVELGDRQVFEEAVGGAAIPGLVDAAVAADQQVVGVVGVDPQGVVVDVLLLLPDPVEGLAAVEGDLEEGVHAVDPVDVVGVGEDLVVVLRAAGDVVRHLRPALAAIRGAEEPALVALRLDHRVEDVGVGGRDVHADLAHVDLGQALGELAPGGAGVGGLVDRRLRAAVDQGPDVAAALVGRRVEHVGVARVHVDLVDAGVVRDVEHAFPGGAAVGGLVDAAVSTRVPQRALRRHVDDVGIPWVDHDHADVLALAETDVLTSSGRRRGSCRPRRRRPPSAGCCSHRSRPTRRWSYWDRGSRSRWSRTSPCRRWVPRWCRC